MESEPGGRLDKLRIAVPSVIGEEPSAIPLFRNVTVPLTPTGPTIAVNVTLCPCTDGLGLELRLVEDLPDWTTSVTVDRLKLWARSPPYTAFTAQLPLPVGAVQEIVAVPLLIGDEPIWVGQEPG